MCVCVFVHIYFLHFSKLFLEQILSSKEGERAKEREGDFKYYISRYICGELCVIVYITQK